MRSVRDALTEFIRGKRLAVLTGAGCSTESGIPDYRGAGAQARARTPIQHRDFVEHEGTRKRYWARSTIGWPRMAASEPNAAHRAIAELERLGRLTGLITQNVDRLHHKAGSRDVLELHGALADVRCMACGEIEARGHLQDRLLADNPSFRAPDAANAATTPDGDAELAASTDDFRVPACVACGGVLKPDVVFFGGSVPRERVSAAFAVLDAADALLVVGSSLAVFSGYRFVLRARDKTSPSPSSTAARRAATHTPPSASMASPAKFCPRSSTTRHAVPRLRANARDCCPHGEHHRRGNRD